MQKKPPIKQLGIAIITFLAIFLMAPEASATCVWSLYNKCDDMGPSWVTATSDSYCSGQKPNGTTVKCCCGANNSSCCAKDRDGKITTTNLTQSECASITYTETIFVPNSVAIANRCYRYAPPFSYSDVTPESKSAHSVASVVVIDESIQPLKFQPQVSIPNSEFGQGEMNVGEYDDSNKVKSDLLARYIKALYDYGLAIAAILAAIILMGGGVLWLTSGGNDTRITQAKELIIGSVSGLAVLFFSWILLNTINPALLQLKTIDTIVAARRSFLNCCDPEAGLSSILVKVENGKIIAQEGDQAGKEISCKTPSKSCKAGEACLAVSEKFDCRVDKVCCECINYLGVGHIGLPVSFTCKNDMTVKDCTDWCREWYTTGYTVDYYWGGSANYTCSATLGFGNCSSK